MRKTAILLACSVLVCARGAARAQDLPKKHSLPSPSAAPRDAGGPAVLFDLPSLPGFDLTTPLGPAAPEPLAPTAPPYGTGGPPFYHPEPAYRLTPIYSPPPMPGDNLRHSLVGPRADSAVTAALGLPAPWPGTTSGLGSSPPPGSATMPPLAPLPTLPGEPDAVSGRPSAGIGPSPPREPSLDVPGLDEQDPERDSPSLVRPFVLRSLLDPRGLHYRALHVDKGLENAALERLRQETRHPQDADSPNDDPLYGAGDRDSQR